MKQLLEPRGILRRTVMASLCLAGFLLSTSAQAQEKGKDGKLSWYGDLRARYEVDYDSVKADGTTERDDRNRGRVRARVGLNYQANESLKFGARLRTGNSRSQQSPHLTFVNDDGADDDDLDFVVDKLFVDYNSEGYHAWLGRNGFPFWKQNELFWDDDVTLTGAAASFSWKAQSELTATIGGFALPDGGYDLHGDMVAGQLKHSYGFGENSRLTSAAGLFYMAGDGESTNLRHGNGDREYSIGVANLQLAFRAWDRPISLGSDLFYNFKDYESTSPDRFTAEHHDQDVGYVLSATMGKLKEPGDWLLGYYYADIEALSVNASYAQDDWFRFGGADGQTDSSDFRGHEIRVAFSIRKNLNFVNRLYLVDTISNSQDGSRFRLDLNYKF
ncbi:MAG: hypothetical protein CMI32_08285 [Opitutales bacterium]|nr:hypothetical protein [Opitutales bacterium]